MEYKTGLRKRIFAKISKVITCMYVCTRAHVCVCVCIIMYVHAWEHPTLFFYELIPPEPGWLLQELSGYKHITCPLANEFPSLGNQT